MVATAPVYKLYVPAFPAPALSLSSKVLISTVWTGLVFIYIFCITAEVKFILSVPPPSTKENWASIAPPGVKNCHPEAVKFDIGVYFEANGHGSIAIN